MVSPEVLGLAKDLFMKCTGQTERNMLKCLGALLPK
jgi:hypothetical protein